MIINAKSKLNKEQFEAKVEKNADSFEIQLIEEMNSKNFNIQNYQEELKKYKIRAIHMPLYKYHDYDIEKVESQKILKKVCLLAEEIIDFQNNFFKENEKILVVVHLNISFQLLKEYGLLNRLKKLILELINKYPNIEIGIENVTSINYIKELGTFNFNNGLYLEEFQFKFSNIELVKEINHERCGIVIDTCHLLMNKKVMKKIQKYLKNEIVLDNFIEEYFKQGSQYVKLIHLNYCESHGFHKYHGLAFDKKDKKSMKYLKEIMDLYFKYNYSCMITLEVNEEDYLNCVNFEKTKKALLKIMKEKDK